MVGYAGESACAGKAIGGECPSGLGSACEITCSGGDACSSGTELVARSHTVVLACAGEGACAGLKVKTSIQSFMLKCIGAGACAGIDFGPVQGTRLTHCCEEEADACTGFHGTACGDCKELQTCRAANQCEFSSHIELGAGIATVSYAGDAACASKIIGGGCPRGADTACEIKCDGVGACSGSTLHALSSNVVLKCVGALSCGGLTIVKMGTNVLVLECLGGESCMPAEGTGEGRGNTSLEIPTSDHGVSPYQIGMVSGLHFGYCCAEGVAACDGFKGQGHAFRDCKEVLIPHASSPPGDPPLTA